MTSKDNFKSFVCKFNLDEGCRAALSYNRGKLNIHSHHRRTPGTHASRFFGIVRFLEKFAISPMGPPSENSYSAFRKLE